MRDSDFDINNKAVQKFEKKYAKKCAKLNRKRMLKARKKPLNGLLKLSEITICALLCLNARTCAVSEKEFLKNAPYLDKVGDELGANMEPMKCKQLDDAILRLKPNFDKKVKVYIDEKVPERTRKNIKESLGYFNDILADITDKYEFEVCNKVEYEANKFVKNSTLKFEYQPFYGLSTDITYAEINKGTNKTQFSRDTSSKVYIVNSVIYLNDGYFDKLSDYSQLYVLKHEILHSLGFSDMYQGYRDVTSLICNSSNAFSNKLSPSDLKRLYTAYCEDLVDERGVINKTKLKQVKENIAKYEK